MAEQAPEADASHLREAALRSESSYTGSSFRSLKRKFNDSDDRIVWPPVVIIENTITHFDKQQNTWKGLESQEIRCVLEGVKDIKCVKVIALYGVCGNRGKALVTFPATPSGYMDAHTLSELLEFDQRGRRHWLHVSHSKDPCDPGRVTPDGKKILYGYLATERDMNDADRPGKIVKHWSMESYTEKVLQPLSQCERETEEARKRRAELIEEANQKLRAVEHNREEMDKAAARFRKMNTDIECQKKLEGELEAKHKRSFEEQKKQYQQEKWKVFESFNRRERSIREHFEQNNIVKQNAVIKFEELARRLKEGIHMERRNHEVRSTEQQQLEMMELIKLDSLLQSEMEEKLAMMKKKFQDKLLKLQKQHNDQIIKSRQKLTVEKERFLEEKLRELKKIEIESQEAKIASTTEIERECIICFFDMVTEKLERALFESCGHANICWNCAKKYWKEALKKEGKPSCPTCKTVQQEKFSLFPTQVYK